MSETRPDLRKTTQSINSSFLHAVELNFLLQNYLSLIQRVLGSQKEIVCTPIRIKKNKFFFYFKQILHNNNYYIYCPKLLTSLIKASHCITEGNYHSPYTVHCRASQKKKKNLEFISKQILLIREAFTFPLSTTHIM